MSASKNLGKVFMTPKGIWDKNSNYTKLDIVTNKVGKISCGYIATTDIEKNIEITDNRWLKLFELLDGDLTEEYKAVQTDVTNKATAVNTNKKAVDLIYSQMQKLYDVEISTTTPTNERTGLWINPDDISGVINIPEIKDDEVSDVDTWSSKKIDNVTNSLKEDISTKITKFYASSQGETHLADSDNGKIMDMMLYGRSEQKQYSGKNLLNATLQTTTQNGVTCTANGDGTYTLNGTATDIAIFVVYYNFADVYGSASSLKMVGCPSGGSAQKYFLRSYRKGRNPEILDEYGSGISIGSFKEAESNIAILVKSGVTVNNLIFKPMLTTDTTATYADYEPYTGGQPSPSPDYPQEIKSVVNPIVKVCGKNLFKATLGNVTANGITCTANSDGTYILNGTCTVSTALSKIGIFDHILNEPLYLTGVPSGCGSYLSLSRYDGNNILVTDGKITKIDAGIHTKHIEFWITKGTTLNNVIFKPMLTTDPTATYDDFELYHEQTVTLPYTLNAIPVNSGGNVTIDGQQYIADYVDVERGKVVKRVKVLNISNLDKSKWGFRTDTSEAIGHSTRYYGTSSMLDFDTNINAMSNIAIYGGIGHDVQGTFRLVDAATYLYQFNLDKTKFDKVQDFTDYLASNNVYIQYALKVPQELDLKPEEIVLFKSLSANYPVTNIFINSEQLDGYTVFNYPISMQNGWNYVKQQIGDTRDYIYDMDLQSAEAYVNSEYAVALTELEV